MRNSGPSAESVPCRGPSPSPEPAFQPGQRFGAGRFRLERLLGCGGMGVVWKAFDERLDEDVALKFISDKIRHDPAATLALRRETSRNHSLSHPHIVRAHDLYEAEGEPMFLSMEYIEGRNLQELAREREQRAFPWSEVKVWLPQLCAALGYAHARGVIHRDLKPANVLLTGSGVIKLTDFGLAVALMDPRTAAEGTTGGTLAYMSPQRLHGAPGTITDDVYALGACLFELLCGAPVFHGTDAARGIQFEPAPSLTETRRRRGLTEALPEEVEDLVQRCLSKNPELRPESAGAVLEIVGLGVSVASAPAPVATNHATPPSRRRSLALLLVLAVLAAVVGQQVLTSRPITPTSTWTGYLDLSKAPIRASSFQPPAEPARAFDGVHRNLSRDQYRWASAPVLGPAREWIAVDLGTDMEVERVAVDWELAYAKDFEVRTRRTAEGFVEDPSQWTERGWVRGLKEVNPSAVNDTASQDDAVFDLHGAKVHLGPWLRADATWIGSRPVVARHVMVVPTARGSNNPAVYSIYEIGIAARPHLERTTGRP